MRTVIAIALVFFGAGGLLLHFISEEDRQGRQREREWLDYSQMHHCKIIGEPSFRLPLTTWQCDGGFQVRR